MRVMEHPGQCSTPGCKGLGLLMYGGCCERCWNFAREQDHEAWEANDPESRMRKVRRNWLRVLQVDHAHSWRARLRRRMERLEGWALLVFVSFCLAEFLIDSLPFWVELLTGRRCAWRP